MEVRSNPKLGPGWDRQQVSLRLTPERKAELLALCAGAGPAFTPTDAIDRALEISKQARWEESRQPPERDEISEAFRSEAAYALGLLERQGGDIEQILLSLRGLRQLMSTIADAPDPDSLASSQIQEQAPIPFRAWLEAAMSKAGVRAERSAIARSPWQRRLSSAPGLASLDIMVELVAVDGALLAKPDGFPERSRIDLIEAADPLCNLDLPRPIFLVCQVVGTGWIAHARHATADGQPGEAIGSRRI